jgi:hypothetical protein
VRDLFLWEPVVNGPEYHAELEALDARESLRWLHPISRLTSREELLGFRFPRGQREAIARLDLPSLPRVEARRVVIFVAKMRDCFVRLRDAIARSGNRAEVRVVGEHEGSTNARVPGAALLPTNVVRAMADALSEVP